MSLLDTASLIVTPNGYKEGKLYSVIPSDGSGDMSVVRATTATRVNSAGLVELVPYNFKVQSENLTLGVGLDDTNITTITANTTETLDPFGGYNAEKYNGSTNQYADTYNFIPQNSVITSSVYVKAGTATSFTLRLNASFGTFAFATFDLTNGTVTGTGTDGYAYISSAATAVGNGWYRCSLTYNFISFPTNKILLSQNGSIYVFGWQLVEGSTAKDYQKTETRLNIPRLDYSNGTCPSLLVEPQRTNLITFSEQFDNGAWIKNETTISANIATSPSGLQDADKIIPNTNNTGHNVDRNALTVSLNGTASVFLKASGYNKAAIRSYFTGAYASFDLVNGTILTAVNVTAKIENYGNGWYRCSVNDTGSALYGYVLAVLDASSDPTATYIGDGTSGVLAWGAQLEAGSYSTSYIPTTSASVTRNADVISKTGISSLIGQTEGTLFVDAYITGKDSSNGSILFATDKVSSGALIRIIYTSTNALRFDVFDGSSFQCLISAGAYNVGDRVKVAGGYKNNDFVMYVNGTQIGTDTSGSVPATDTANINTSIYGDTNGSFVNAAALWKTRLTNTQLAQLTTI
jgi:hypothetical protein